MQAELLGPRNAAAWYTHTAVQPAPLTFPIQDATCFKCRQDVTQRGFVPKESVTIVGGAGRRSDDGRPGCPGRFLSPVHVRGPSAIL
ncbi:MAG: hypothetical protein M1401_03250 [Chloroflexi bacterium]|nr:hypothetical protein [Chloroflexota bacterium]MCL5107884.1 hypothetical protein [Chloroflexota bacterium]